MEEVESVVVGGGRCRSTTKSIFFIHSTRLPVNVLCALGPGLQRGPWPVGAQSFTFSLMEPQWGESMGVGSVFLISAMETQNLLVHRSFGTLAEGK